jgi:hypothetical protein
MHKSVMKRYDSMQDYNKEKIKSLLLGDICNTCFFAMDESIDNKTKLVCTLSLRDKKWNDWCGSFVTSTPF